MATGSGLYSTTSTIQTGIIPNKLHVVLKLLNLRPAVCMLMQQALILKYMPCNLKGFGRTVNEECLVSEIRVTEEKQLNSYEVRKVNDDVDVDDDDDNGDDDDDDDDDNNNNNNNNNINQLYYFSDFGG